MDETVAPLGATGLWKEHPLSDNPCSFTLEDLDRSACAVLVIDECGPAEDLDPRLESMVEHTAKLCASARAAGVPVIFACDAHIPGLDRELLLWGNHGLAGTPACLPTPALGFAEGDYYVAKRRYSAFFQTGLRLLLEELGVSTLIVVGFDTNICVRHTLADAYFNKYESVVVTDATATFLVGTQANGLHEIEVCYGSLLASTDEVCAFLTAKE